jgi:hypothetical protein
MRRVALVLAAVFPLALGGCGDSTGPGGSLAGTYTLRSISGDPLPVVIDEGVDFRREVTAGFVRLNGNGTFTASHTDRITSGTSITPRTEDINGTYTRFGNELTLTFNDPDGFRTVEIIALWGGDLLTIAGGGDVWVYER